MTRARYVTGLRAVEELLRNKRNDVRRVFAEYRTANPRVEAVMEQARRAGIDVQQANRARLQQMSGEHRHQGVVAEISRSTTLDEAELRSLVEARLTDGGRPLLLLMLDGVQDPHNLGACLRTADAAGVDAVVVGKHGAAGLGPAVSKVAAGAAEVLPFAPVPSLGRVLDWLGDYGVLRLGTSDRAETSLFDSELDRPLALAIGQEEKGLSRAVENRMDTIVRLPMLGTVDSLNLSVAAGICLYEALRQRRARSGTPNPAA